MSVHASIGRLATLFMLDYRERCSCMVYALRRLHLLHLGVTFIPYLQYSFILSRISLTDALRWLVTNATCPYMATHSYITVYMTRSWPWAYWRYELTFHSADISLFCQACNVHTIFIYNLYVDLWVTRECTVTATWQEQHGSRVATIIQGI